MRICFEDVSVVVEAITPAGRAPRALLSEIELTLAEHRIAVIGANGSGKSTLLRLINGLVKPTSGRVRVDDLEVAKQAKAVRRKVGFVFTDPLSQLVMPTPAEDVELSLRRLVPEAGQRRRRALDLLAERGLDHVAHSSIYDLSGGERQLAALVSVLAVEPSVLVLDEPTTLLDLRHRWALRRVLRELPQMLVLATHDLELAADFDRVLVIDRGRVFFDGPPEPAIAAYVALMEVGDER